MMKLPPMLDKIHWAVTGWMDKSKFVRNVLVATYTHPDGEEYDCIYCTIIRCALIFGFIGFVLGRVL